MRSVLGSPGSSLTKEWSQLSSSSLSRGLSPPATRPSDADAMVSEPVEEEGTTVVPSPATEAISTVRSGWRLSCSDRSQRRCEEGEDEERGLNLEKRRGEKWRSIASLSHARGFYFSRLPDSPVVILLLVLFLTDLLAWYVAGGEGRRGNVMDPVLCFIGLNWAG
jgi:hypothetical protein